MASSLYRANRDTNPAVERLMVKTDEAKTFDPVVGDAVTDLTSVRLPVARLPFYAVIGLLTPFRASGLEEGLLDVVVTA